MVVMIGAAMILIERGCVAVPPALSVTWTVKLDKPAVVGVPVIAPLVAFRERPAGSDPLLTVHLSPTPDPPDAASGCE